MHLTPFLTYHVHVIRRLKTFTFLTCRKHFTANGQGKVGFCYSRKLGYSILKTYVFGIFPCHVLKRFVENKILLLFNQYRVKTVKFSLTNIVWPYYGEHKICFHLLLKTTSNRLKVRYMMARYISAYMSLDNII